MTKAEHDDMHFKQDKQDDHQDNDEEDDDYQQAEKVVVVPDDQASNYSKFSYAGNLIADDKDAPEDNGNAVMIVFLLWGMCVLQPEQAMIAAMSYFELCMPTMHPINYFTFALYLPQCFAIILVDIYGGKCNFNTRISGGLFFAAIFTMALPFLASLGDQLGFWMCYLDLMILACCVGVFQGSLYSLAAQFPSKYIATAILGVSVSGLSSNAFRGISFLIGFETLKESTLFFYGVSTAFLLIAASCFTIIARSNVYFLYYYSKILQNQNSKVVSPNDIKNVGDYLKALGRQFRKTKGLYGGIFFCFMMTFTLFPPTVFATEFTFLKTWADPTTALQFIMLVTFNLADSSGRILGGMECLIIQRLPILRLTYLRVLFFATFIPILFQTKPYWLFTQDWFKISNTFLLGISNGYCSTVAVILAPAHVHIKMRPQTGALVTAAITFGITAGALLQFPMGQLIAISPSNGEPIDPVVFVGNTTVFPVNPVLQ